MNKPMNYIEEAALAEKYIPRELQYLYDVQVTFTKKEGEL